MLKLDDLLDKAIQDEITRTGKVLTPAEHRYMTEQMKKAIAEKMAKLGDARRLWQTLFTTTSY